MDRKEYAMAFINVVDFLERMGIKPKPGGGRYLYYISPFRQEDIPSFMVDTKQNRWIDFGMAPLAGSGKKFAGGRVIEFLMVYYKCSRETALERLQSAAFVYVEPSIKREEKTGEDEPHNILLATRAITRNSLKHYLRSRCIPLHVAALCCCEVDYEFKGRKYYGIGFKNDLGGYEIRNQLSKTGTSPKGITTIENGANKVAVFEGFFNYMSFLAIHGIGVAKDYNFCILNSAAFLANAFEFLEKHEAVWLYLDNDNTGLKYRINALKRNALCGDKYKHGGKFFSPRKDLNEWLCADQERFRKNRQHRL